MGDKDDNAHAGETNVTKVHGEGINKEDLHGGNCDFDMACCYIFYVC